MKTIKTNIIYILLLGIVISFTACNETLVVNEAPNNNYIILLDLSDRLLANRQDVQDIESILSIFDKFEKDVTRKLIINSQDRFSIRVLPQPDSPVDFDSLNNSLTIDMSSIAINMKKNKLLKFKDDLRNKLKILYRMAYLGNSPSDYQGVDIWRYFNESLHYDLIDHAENKLVILSDGYFDFESFSHTIHVDNRYSSTYFFRFLNRDDWKDFANNNDYGLLPVYKPFPQISALVIGINPKNTSLSEIEKLCYFWEKWLSEMNFNSKKIIKKTNSEHLKQILQDTNI